LTLKDGWLVTGDIGHFDEDGFMTVAGRLSRFSKIGGEMVPHGAIEQKLIEVFDIEQAEGPAVVVVGVPDSAKGEALVVLSLRELAPEAVRERLSAAGLPNLWIPKAVVRLERIPLLGTGKLDVNACREIAAAATAPRPARAAI
jgi:acyl-[acyl-carrier-protein]-phospholipid O-acyltransferase/long-chain-fatty-acid--[acyl-carrier-protein] ligase